MKSSGFNRTAILIALALVLAGCASTKFVSTWKNPEVAPVSREKGQTVICCVVVDDDYIRFEGEDALAAELTKRGANAVPSYQILKQLPKDESVAKAAFAEAGAVAVVVMRPVGLEAETTGLTVFTGPGYATFWGGYYGYGWVNPYMVTSASTDRIVAVETLFYSLELNKLIWTGVSKTTNPSKVRAFVKELVVAAAWEMSHAKVWAK